MDSNSDSWNSFKELILAISNLSILAFALLGILIVLVVAFQPDIRKWVTSFRTARYKDKEREILVETHEQVAPETDLTNRPEPTEPPADVEDLSPGVKDSESADVFDDFII